MSHPGLAASSPEQCHLITSPTSYVPALVQPMKGQMKYVSVCDMRVQFLAAVMRSGRLKKARKLAFMVISRMLRNDFM